MIQVEMYPDDNQMILRSEGESIGFVCQNGNRSPIFHPSFDKDDVMIQFNTIVILSFNDIKIIQNNWNQMQEIRKKNGQS